MLRPYPIRKWPEEERPREQLIARGPEALSEAQLLAIILRTGTSLSGSALDLARELLTEFGSLTGLGDASVAELCRHRGMGAAKAAQVKAALELGRRSLRDALGPRQGFSSSRDAAAYLSPSMNRLRQETFKALLLNIKNQLMREATIAQGGLTSSLVHPREVFLPAIREGAPLVIFAHNHPSGDPSPSRDDLLLSRRLSEAGKLLGVEVLDHIIIGGNSYYSFADDGRLPRG